MASLGKAISKDFFENVLPVYGKERVRIPIWDNGQKMFILDEYESANGNRHYKGIRFCDRIVVVEKVGLFHNWTYIDGIELYAFNGTKLELIQKRDYDKVFRNEDFIRSESQSMVQDYLKGVVKAQGINISDNEIESPPAETFKPSDEKILPTKSRHCNI